MKQPTQRYSLNSNQIHILKLLFKFRFITGLLLAKYKGINRSSSNRSLKRLLDQGYIGMKFRQDYLIQGKGPRYYLEPKAIRYLKDIHGLNGKVLLNMYKNKSVSEVFVDHNIDIVEVYLSLRDAYSTVFHMFTKSELGDYDYFPEPRPDLYLNRTKPTTNQANEYLLYAYTVTPPYIIKKQIEALIDHYDSDDWQTETQTDYPDILIVCPNQTTENNLQRHITKTLDNKGIDDLNIYTTSVKALVSPQSSEKAIWSNVIEPEKLVALV